MRSCWIEVFVLSLIGLAIVSFAYRPMIQRQMKFINSIYKTAGYGKVW